MTEHSPFDEIYAVDVMVLGIGCTLYSDEGFGVRVVEKMQRDYEFPDDVLLVDGGVLGINLLGVISKPVHLIGWMPSATKVNPEICTVWQEMRSRNAFGPKIHYIRLIFWKP